MEQLFSVQMEKALAGLALKTEVKAADKEPTSVKKPAVPQTAADQVPQALKGVPQTLVERVGAPAQSLPASGFFASD